MKKLFLTIGVFIFSLNVCSQKLIDLKKLVGYWEPDKHSSQLVMWFDKHDYFQVVKFDTVDGEPLDVVSVKLVGDTMKIKIYCKSTDFTSEGLYKIIDENTLECKVVGHEDDKITYTRVK